MKGPIQPDSHCEVKGNAVVRVPIPEAKGYAVLGHTEDAAGDEKGLTSKYLGRDPQGKVGTALGLSLGMRQVPLRSRCMPSMRCEHGSHG